MPRLRSSSAVKKQRKCETKSCDEENNKILYSEKKGKATLTLSNDNESDSESEFESELADLASRVSSQLRQHEPTELENSLEGSEFTADCQFIVDKSGHSGNLTGTDVQHSATLQNYAVDDDGAESDESEDSSSGDMSDSSTEDMREKNKHKSQIAQLASTLEPGVDIEQMSYINSNVEQRLSVKNKKLEDLLPKQGQHAELLKKSVLTSDLEKKSSLPPYKEGFRQMKKKRQAERAKTKGSGWYGMPATELTEKKKNDLMLLQMRRVLDPKRFYKANDLKTLPKYFQMGTVVESAADFYSSRIPKKQRKKTLVDELLEDAEFRKYNKKKYAEIQEKSTSRHKGAFKHMKRLKKKKR